MALPPARGVRVIPARVRSAGLEGGPRSWYHQQESSLR